MVIDHDLWSGRSNDYSTDDHINTASSRRSRRDTNFPLSDAVSAVIDFTGVNNGSAPYDMTITVRMPADDTTVFSGMNIIVTEGGVPVKLAGQKTVQVTNATAQSVLNAELANIMTDPDNHANSNTNNQGGQHMYPGYYRGVL